MLDQPTTVEEIASHCFKRILSENKRPLFISITGDSGSGKSYYSEKIRSLFDEANIPYSYLDHDSFLIAREEREPLKNKVYQEGEFKGKTYWEILENWFKMDEYDRVIKELREGNPATYYPYKRELGGPDSVPVTIQPNEFIIFDTTMQTEKTDFVILIEVSLENIIKRKLERDKDLRTPEQIVDMHKRVQGYCWERTRPTDTDIIIDNNDFTQPFIIKK